MSGSPRFRTLILVCLREPRGPLAPVALCLLGVFPADFFAHWPLKFVGGTFLPCDPWPSSPSQLHKLLSIATRLASTALSGAIALLQIHSLRLSLVERTRV
ncbi:MAG: hypothetical protein OEM00_01840 [Burkholderiaceae bacterium]|nr:hypothetical protein [Burkholderiaceae bacterium]